MNRHLTPVIIAVAAVLALGSTLSAHMKFAKAAPAASSSVTAPPSSIQVWFTEAPDPKVSKLDLKGPAGPVKLTDLHVMDKMSLMALVGDAMPDGAYTVSWQSAGDDGHVQKGEFTFTVKRAK
jgi:methionine-rich copper-binding protein CopC